MAQNGTNQKISAKQKKIVYLMLDFDDKRKLKEKLAEVNVPRRTFYNWMAEQKFKDYIQSQVDAYASAKLPDAWKSLFKNIDRGETSAIKLYFELTGKYMQKSEVDLNLPQIILKRGGVNE